MGAETVELSPVAGRRRYLWGMGLLLGAAILGAGSVGLVAWGWSTRGRLAILGLSEWHFVLAGVFLGGVAGVAGFIMLFGQVLGGIRRTWVRWTATTASLLLVLATILVWLFALLFLMVMAGWSEYTEVESPSGVRVIVEHGGFDPDDYDIYVQKSGFVYVWAAGTTTVGNEPALTGCSLAEGDSVLVLTCGGHVVEVPPVGK